jgi:hypothetical protein
MLIMGAGTGSGNNVVRSLRAGDSSLRIIGCHSDRFALGLSNADRNYLVPPAGAPTFFDAIARVNAREHVDLLIPTTDADVRLLAVHADRVPVRVLLPRLEMIELCQDKYRLAVALRECGQSAPRTCAIENLDAIDAVFESFAPQTRLWCRIRRGQGAWGAMLVTSPEEARSWIGFWCAQRGIAPDAFTLSEYLPGRDFACQTLWDRGRLVLLKMYERLTYVGGVGPSGGSSIAALSKTVFEAAVAETCARAVPALAPDASGIFVFDLKENADGTPAITEINAGRFGMSTNIFDLPGKRNMAVSYVRLALGEALDHGDPYDIAEDYYMVRDADVAPVVFHADELFDAIEDARS